MHVAEEIREIAQGRAAEVGDGPVFFRFVSRLGHHAVLVLGGHGQHAAEQVAEIIGEVGVDTGDKGIVIEVGVGAEVHLGEHEVAEGIGAEELNHALRMDDVAEALGHLGVAHEPVAVHVEVLIHGQSGGMEHAGPENAVGLEDILGYQVLAGPVLFVVRSVRPAESGDIVEERVEPDVGDVVLVERKLDAPGETALGTGNAEVLETAGIDEAEKF